MALFLPQRWRQQPQGPVTIDWSNPLSAGLVSALQPAENRDILNPVAFTKRGVIDVGLQGRGANVTGATIVQTGIISTIPTDLTIAAYWQGIGTRDINGYRGIQGWSAGGGLHNAYYGVATQDQTLVGFGTVGSIILSAGVAPIPVADTQLHFTALAKTGTTYRFLSDRGYTTGTASGATTHQAPIVLGLFRPDATYEPWHGRYYLSLAWKRGLVESELRALSENPWQIFSRQKQIIYSLPAVETVIKTFYITQQGNSTGSVTVSAAELANVSAWPANLKIRITSTNVGTVDLGTYSYESRLYWLEAGYNPVGGGFSFGTIID